jgi:hypothetical protein
MNFRSFSLVAFTHPYFDPQNASQVKFAPFNVSAFGNDLDRGCCFGK